MIDNYGRVYDSVRGVDWDRGGDAYYDYNEDYRPDLYDQGYVYVQIDAGQWLIDHAQRQIRDAYAPIRPPIGAPVKPATPEQSTSPVRPAGQQRLSPYSPGNSESPDIGPLLPPTDGLDPSN